MDIDSTLDNFPFKSMEEFNSAFKDGVAEPVVPGEFARKWVAKVGTPGEKLLMTIFNGLIPMLLIGLTIWLTVKSDYLKWYHCLIALLICVFSFSPNINGKTRNIFTLLVFGYAVYLYYTGSEFANMIAIAFGFMISIKLTDYVAFKSTIQSILYDEEITKQLWNMEVLAIRYPEGKVVFKSKTMNVK